MDTKRITIINQDSGYLMIDIANAFAEQGFEVSIITGRLTQRSQPPDPRVRIKKIIPFNRSSIQSRLYTWLIGFFQIWFHVVFYYRKSHLLIVSNPPFAPFLPLLVKNPFSLYIFDIYPDILIEFGMLSVKNPIIHLWKTANKKIFRKAQHIFTLTEGMKSVLEQYTTRPVKVIPIWSDKNFFIPIDKKNNWFIRRHHLEEKFIVLYSGNLGITHNLGIIIDLARMTEDSEILFLIIGEGNQKKMLESQIASLNLRNCLLLPRQRTEDLPYSFSSADLALVTLSTKASKYSIPSKTYDFLTAGIPVLGVAGKDSELYRILDSYNAGKCFRPDQLTEIKEFIYHCMKEKEYYNSLKSNALMLSRQFQSNSFSQLII